VVALFHPRCDTWHEHFRLNNDPGVIKPRTAHGRVTERVLRFNQNELVMDRLRLMALGEYREEDL
jgi:hypothetical protein